MIEFQSGHPVRGATRPQRPRKALCPNFNPRAPCGARRDRRCGDHARADISIHAPRVGRDVQILGRVVELRAFQSTRPVWGATDIKCARLMVLPISIHAPRVGRDHYCATAREYYAISIHAPRVGRDLRKRDFRDIVSAISIHAPRVGRDKSIIWSLCTLTNFNPRAPCGARRLTADPEMRKTIFQSTRPVWGATDNFHEIRQPYSYFNPRAPCGARQQI